MLLPIPSKVGYSRYKVDTDNSKVWDCDRKRYLVANPNVNGYCYVGLVDDKGNKVSHGLHRVIMASYSGIDLELFKRGGIEIDHLDDNPSNNELSNLSITDRKGQYRESTRLKMSKPRTRLKIEDVCLILEQLEEMRQYEDYKQSVFINQMCEAYNVAYRTMYNIVTGVSYKDLHSYLS